MTSYPLLITLVSCDCHVKDELSAAVERKAQLKEELATIRDELAQCREKYRCFSSATFKLCVIPVGI